MSLRKKILLITLAFIVFLMLVLWLFVNGIIPFGYFYENRQIESECKKQCEVNNGKQVGKIKTGQEWITFEGSIEECKARCIAL